MFGNTFRTASVLSKLRWTHLVLIGAWFASASAEVPPKGYFGIFPSPTVPLAAKPFRLHVRFVTIGAPVTVVNTNVHVNGSTIDISACTKDGSSSTAPTTVNIEVDAPGLPAGMYSLRFTRSYLFASAPDCVYPTVLHQSMVSVLDPASLVSVVEYFSSLRNHYFQTANPAEMDALDTGVFPGWMRTGQSFGAYRTGTAGSSQPLLSPVCRYYGRPEYGLDTHFFSAFLFECQVVPINWPNVWIEESTDAFATPIPFSYDGSCPPGTLPVYRLFNGKADVNHRYTTSLAVRSEMIANGWIPEGFGSIGVAMCAQPRSDLYLAFAPRAS